MGTRYSSIILATVFFVIAIFSPLTPFHGATYDWPIVIDPTSGESRQSTIVATMAEPRDDNGTNRDHFHWGVDIDDNYLVNITDQYPLYAKALDDGTLLAVNDPECIKHSMFRYCHVNFRPGFRAGKEVESGDVFAVLEDVGNDNSEDGDHLHLEEATENFSDTEQEFDIDRIDPLRSFRGEDDGLENTGINDSTEPEVNEITFFENDPNPTVNNNPEPFPRLNANDPEDPPDRMDEPGDDTWVVWGPVDVGAKIRDDGISPNGTLPSIDLGIFEVSFRISEN